MCVFVFFLPLSTTIITIPPPQILRTKALELLVHGQEVLGSGLASLSTKNQLGLQLPVGGDLPLGGDAVVDERVVVLEVGAQALGLERGPDSVLQHGVRMGRPEGEAIGIDGELLLHAVDDFLVFEEEYLGERKKDEG